MAKAGRKALYDDWLTEDGLLQIKGWARDGLTDEEIARHRIGIAPQTLAKWKAQFGELRQALKEGRKPVAVKIEDSFLSKLEWRQVEETEERIWKDSNGKEQKQVVRRKRWIAPDTACLIFAIKNHIPQRYSDHPMMDTSAEELNDRKALVDILQHPQPNRRIGDFEE